MNPQNPEFIHICHPQPKVEGGLSNLRLGVKDLFDIAGIPTSAGNPDWLATHPIPQITAPCVTALLEAGANLIGKTLTDELAYSLEGINKHYGTPTNPQAPERMPGGSSSGSAVAVANNSIDIGLGTDTGGSIRVPASYNGLYGFRPSHSLINCDRLIPLAPRFDTIGWLTRDFSTMEKVAKILLPARNNNHLSRLIVGNIEGIEAWHTNLKPILEAISSQFTSVESVDITAQQLAQASSAFRILQGREIWHIHGEWLEQQKPDLATEIRDRFMWCKSLSQSDEQEAEKTAQKFINDWRDRILPNDNCVLLFPTTPGAAPLLNTSPEKLRTYRTQLMGLTAPAGLTRAPQISLPYLSREQAPWGVSLLARNNCDRALLDCVAKLDRACT